MPNVLFWCKLKYVAKYAFCAIFEIKIFICAILYTFSISGAKGGTERVRDFLRHHAPLPLMFQMFTISIILSTFIPLYNFIKCHQYSSIFTHLSNSTQSRSFSIHCHNPFVSIFFHIHFRTFPPEPFESQNQSEKSRLTTSHPIIHGCTHL